MRDPLFLRQAQVETGHWEGVVMVIRRDMSRASFGLDPQCPVVSARSSAYGGRRAINHRMPYSQVRHYFDSDDEDHVFVHAEYRDGHLQLFEKRYIVFGDWVETAVSPDALRNPSTTASQ